LIVRCLTADRLAVLIEHAQSVSLVPFVEVTTEQEAKLALDAGAELIGVNARDLDTLQIDLERAHSVLRALPSEVTRVHLSGVTNAKVVTTVLKGPADAALIGEILMRQDDPSGLLVELVQAAAN
jgi:indole-3-glycerol phosphate synthase